MVDCELNTRCSRVLRGQEKNRDPIYIGALRATRWSGSPGALEYLESLKLSEKFADRLALTRVQWVPYT